MRSLTVDTKLVIETIYDDEEKDKTVRKIQGDTLTTGDLIREFHNMLLAHGYGEGAIKMGMFAHIQDKNWTQELWESDADI